MTELGTSLPSPTSLLSELRRQFHASLLATQLTLDAEGVASIADKKNAASKGIARRLIEILGAEANAPKLKGQTSGSRFEVQVHAFLSQALPHVSPLKPGILQVHRGHAISQFAQYAHLSAVEAAIEENRELKAALGGDYIIKPDVVVSRRPETDDEINHSEAVVDLDVARLTDLRKINNPHDILHASISCKWTLRSDRAQNARSEALNLVRNRKGRLPHTVVVTAEPLPSRIASLALGTGDMDCIYFIALPELRQATRELRLNSHEEMIELLVEGKRLRDISDLPLDLVV